VILNASMPVFPTLPFLRLAVPSLVLLVLLIRQLDTKLVRWASKL
jgi:hypothetical protein